MGIPASYQPFVDDIHGMIGLCEEDFELFREHRAFFVRNGGAMVEAIASILMAHAASRSVFEEGRGDLGSLKGKLGAWVGGLLEAHDDPEFWHRQFVIGIEHIVRRIPNRQMIGLATKIRELLLPLMIDTLGDGEGLRLYFAFQRMLDSVVALTTTLVDEGQRRCLLDATGFSPELVRRLQAIVFEKIRAELLPRG